MTAYLDASVVFSILVEDTHSERVESWLSQEPVLAFSLWTIAETSSGLSHAHRTGRLTAQERAMAESEMDRLLNPAAPSTAIGPDDFHAARGLLGRHGSLRAPDALHLALAERNGWALATLDHKLAVAATAQGVTLAFP